MNIKRHFTALLSAALLAVVSLAIGCSDTSEPGTSSTNPDATGHATLPAGLFLDTAPEGIASIKSLKPTAKEGDEVVVRVVVGGRMDPISDGRASANVVDAGLTNSCLSEDDHCNTPWDYCCALPEDITANLATLQIVDEQGRVVAADLSQHMKPLSILVIKGTVGPRPDPQVLTLHATGIFVESSIQ